MGIPQGTVIGPCGFLIFVKFLCSLDTNGRVISFSEGTIILLRNINWVETPQIATQGVRRLFNLLCDRKLSLNVEDIKCVTFTTLKRGHPEGLELNIHDTNCNAIDCQDMCKTL